MLKDANGGVLKLLAEQCLETCDSGRIDDWAGGTTAAHVQSVKETFR